MPKQPETALDKIIKAINGLSYTFWFICAALTVQWIFFGVSADPLTSKQVIKIEAFCDENNLGTSVNWDLWTQKTTGVACTGVKPAGKSTKQPD